MIFSIIVPVYKTEKYIHQCVDSILNQTFKDFEVILVDDGSPDNCPEICDKYTKNDSRIKVIHKENGGLVSARIAGTEIAQGDYILNIDSDDYISENLLEEVSRAIDKTKTDIIYFGYCRFNSLNKKDYSIDFGKKLLYKKDLEELYPYILSDSKTSKLFDFGILPPVCFKAIKKDLIEKYQLSVDASISLGEDLAVTLPMMFEAESMYVIDKPLYYYRTNESSITQGFNNNYSIQAFNLVKYIENKVDLSKYNLKVQLCEFIIHLLFDIVMSNAKHFDKYSDYISKCNEIDDYLIGKLKDYKSRKNFKHKLITFFIKYRWFWIFWIIIKLKGKK